jgi:glucose-1-phosphate thymidylyltransferase
VKALVLAGGTGSRLRPFSYSTPKQLVPVANEPVLFHGLRALRSAGVTEAGIVVSGPGTAIRAAVGDGSDFGLAVRYLPQDAPRGLAHCVLIARDFLGDDDFAMLLGDTVFADGISEPMAQFHAHRPAAQLVVTKVANPTEYGVVELDGSGQVIGLEEKPAHPRSNLAIAGVYFFTAQIHEAAAAIRPSWRNELEITDAIQWLVQHGRPVRAHPYAGYCRDTGKVTDMLDCNRVLLEGLTPAVRGSVDPLTQLSGAVVIEAGAMVEASRIDGPVIIGSGSRVIDSYLGPYTSVGAGCRLENAGVEDSILLDRSSVRGVRSIKGSLIGRAADVRPCGQEMRAHRLIMGDDSRVEVPV